MLEAERHLHICYCVYPTYFREVRARRGRKERRPWKEVIGKNCGVGWVCLPLDQKSLRGRVGSQLLSFNTSGGLKTATQGEKT